MWTRRDLLGISAWPKFSHKRLVSDDEQHTARAAVCQPTLVVAVLEVCRNRNFLYGGVAGGPNDGNWTTRQETQDFQDCD